MTIRSVIAAVLASGAAFLVGCPDPASPGDDDDTSPAAPDDHITVDGAEICGDLGSVFWGENFGSTCVFAFRTSNVCERQSEIRPEMDDVAMEYVLANATAEQDQDPLAACEALLNYHHALSDMGMYEFWYPSDSCTYSACYWRDEWDDDAQLPIDDAAPSISMRTMVADVPDAIDAFIGDCDDLTTWEDWNALYNSFFSLDYWPGAIYESDDSAVQVTAAPGDRLLFSASAVEMTSRSGETITVDVDLDASFCSW